MVLLSLVVANSRGEAQVFIGGIINNYYPVMSLDICNNRVAIPFLVTGLNIGDRVLLMQMDGALIDTTNTASYGSIIDLRQAGRYELLTVGDVTFNHITFLEAIAGNYDADARLQIIRVPVYTDVVVALPLQAQPWNGATGGVIALMCSGSIVLLADIDASGTGFRGGPAANNISCISGGAGYLGYASPVVSATGGMKGEGIGQVFDKPLARGAPANGGGGGNNSQTGGGGGSNAAAAGAGGIRNNMGSGCNGPAPGLGGYALMQSANSGRAFLGGGGGAGDGNSGGATSGGNGGGIVFIRAASLDGLGNRIKANGASVTSIAIHDGAGGGGGGGTLILDIGTISNVLLQANGGNGGNVDNGPFGADSCFGPGGGGSGGFICVAGGTLPPNYEVLGGQAGTTIGAACLAPSNWATHGQNGVALTSLLVMESTTLYTPLSLSVSSDTIVCLGTPAQLKATAAGTGTLTFSWSHGANTHTTFVWPSQPTVYQVTVSDARGCSLTETVQVDVKSISTNAYAFPDSIVLGQKPIYLYADTAGIQTFEWSPNWWLNDPHVFNPIAQPQDTITYCVYVTGYNGCRDTACVDVMVVVPEPAVHIPTAFTPNGDGINDEWKIIAHKCYTIQTIKVWNRWGQLIYDYVTEGGRPWNGTYNGQPQAMETYMYYVKATCSERNTEEEFRGSVTLIR